ncbi:flagellar export chaperone FliS [uncultured Desulfobacter sp.]|uniref:flagellar export chaperone FliS n=1 Tax=uncultured Desulfobacter sp. TaxID=240139 RepID=UPI0029F5269C|nr:flagellar export chaperone FliS [uncultured Desulfobacter sp.]
MVYNALSSYQKVQVSSEINPQKLILMLYDGAIKRISFAREGVINKDPKQRGENLSKAIAIIAELNASLRDIEDEQIFFLKSLFLAMMQELCKVSISNDIQTLDRATKYLMELKRIWETSVMGLEDTGGKNNTKAAQKKDVSSMSYSGYEKHGLKTSIAI